MYSDRLEKWFTLTANFDSGTTENWITKNVVDLLQHVIVTVPYTKYQTFSGETLDSSLLVHDILWHGDGTSARSRSTDFRVIGNSAPFEVLFGSDFIFSESVYSFNEANLILTKVKETPGTFKQARKLYRVRKTLNVFVGAFIAWYNAAGPKQLCNCANQTIITSDDRRNREINRAKADAEAKLLAQERKMIEAPPKNIPKFERSTEEKVKGRRR